MVRVLHRLIGCWFVWLLSTAVTLGQTGGTAPADPAAAPSAIDAPSTRPKADVATLVIVAQVEDKFERADIRNTFKQALTHIPATADASTPPVSALFKFDLNGVEIKRIDRKAFSEVAGLVGGKRLRDENFGPLVMERDEKERKDWVLNLGSKDFFLESIVVTYVDDQKKEATKEYKTQVTGAISGLRSQRPGVYILTLDEPGTPRNYVAEIFDRKTDKTELVKGGWPVGENYYMISLPEFSGSIDDLIETLRNEKAFYVAEPFKIDDVAPASIMLARLGRVNEGGTRRWKQNQYTVGFGPLAETLAQRVWIRFPLTEKQAKEEAQRLLELKSDGDNVTQGELISAEIRKQGPKQTRPYKLLPQDGTQWFEFPAIVEKSVGPDGSVRTSVAKYEATFALEDIPAWKRLPEPPSWRLIVYEFDNGSQQQAVRISRSKQGGSDGARVVDELDEDFVVGIRDLETQNAAADAGAATPPAPAPAPSK